MPKTTNPQSSRRLRLTIAFDGRPYRGWQSQRGGAIQDFIESAFSKILQSQQPRPVIVHGCGRTDSGVHALAMTAHCDVPTCQPLPNDAWQRALNAILPATIRILNVADAPPDFHARFNATGKTYRYLLSTQPILPPLDAGLAWHVPHNLNIHTMTTAISLFQGTHDFSNFAARRRDGTDKPHASNANQRTISHTSLSSSPNHLTLTFTGSGFLYRQVRLMTGAITQAGLGKLSLDTLKTALTQPHSFNWTSSQNTPNSHPRPLCAPPDGLTLVEVFYPSHSSSKFTPTHPE